jgi:hypothetical protein
MRRLSRVADRLFLQGGYEVCGDLVRRRRTPGDADIDGQQFFERTDELGAVSEDVAAKGAIAESRHEARLRHRSVRGLERPGHPGGDRPSDKQDVCMPGRGDDVQAVALKVMEGVCDGAELVLATVA